MSCALQNRWGVEFGPLREVADDPAVTDIAVLGDGKVWADKGQGMIPVSTKIPCQYPGLVRQLAVNLCAQLGARLDESCPIADASNPQGVRIHAVLEPIVPSGASISIRLPPRHTLSLEDLYQHGLMPAQWASLLRFLVSARATFLVSGGTGTGKTTLVRALISQCPPRDRIVIVEEVRELGGIGRPDCVSLASRSPNAEGKGGVGLDELVRATVRMRPDRIVLGECRGKEIADLMRAFNIGHRGGFVTLHADNLERVPSRLITLGLLADLDPQLTAHLSEQAFDVIVHLCRDSVTGRRRIAQIGFLTLSAHSGLTGMVALSWDGRSAPRCFPAAHEFARRWAIPRNYYMPDDGSGNHKGGEKDV